MKKENAGGAGEDDDGAGEPIVLFLVGLAGVLILSPVAILVCSLDQSIRPVLNLVVLVAGTISEEQANAIDVAVEFIVYYHGRHGELAEAVEITGAGGGIC